MRSPLLDTLDLLTMQSIRETVKKALPTDLYTQKKTEACKSFRLVLAHLPTLNRLQVVQKVASHAAARPNIDESTVALILATGLDWIEEENKECPQHPSTTVDTP